MKYVKKKLSELKPYENNPRINDEAVDDVAESIKQCSYIAPIIIDEDGVILAGHDGRRGIIHHMCVHPDFRRQGVARMLVRKAEEALREEGITKVFGLVFRDNEAGNAFWESEGYTLRTNLNYRNKSLNEKVPQGE